MAINLKAPELTELRPRITVLGVGGAGGNAVNNMIESKLDGVEFVVANTDAQALAQSRAERRIQLGHRTTEGLGAGASPDVGKAGAEESLDEIMEQLAGSHMVFITAGRGGGTGTGAAPVIARAVRERGILTVGVVTKPFAFEGDRRMRAAERGIAELQQYVHTLIVIPNQNLFRVANDRTTFAQAFQMADEVLHAGVRGVTDLIVMPGLINLDFADIKSVISEMGKAMMGTGEAEGEDRARHAAEAAIANPLLDDVSMHGARGLLISITGGPDLTLYEVDEAASRIREEVDADANIILGATYDADMTGSIRVSVVATGTDATMVQALEPMKASTTRAPLQASAVRRAMEQAPQAAPVVEEPVQAQQFEADVRQAVAEAITYEPTQQYEDSDDGITVEPYIPAASLDSFEEPARAAEQPMPSVYVPSHAERPEGQRRMPRTEEFPAVARKTLVAEERHDQEPRNARALFKRLASNVGLGLRPQQHPGLAEPQFPAAGDVDARAAIEAGTGRNSGASAASHGAAGQLDPHGRTLPQKEHIEIPSFLRKHG